MEINITIEKVIIQMPNDDSKQDLIIQKINELMSTQKERFAAFNQKLDAVTNDIAADFEQLLKSVEDKIPEEDFSKAEANLEKLRGLGASVENPIPGETVDPVITDETTSGHTGTEGSETSGTPVVTDEAGNEKPVEETSGNPGFATNPNA
jgi:hypothetical protein